MIPSIRDEQAFRAALEPFLQRLRLSRMFMNMDVRWCGMEAAEFALLLQAMANWIDTDGVGLVADAITRRDIAIGQEARDISEMIHSRNGEGFLVLLAPVTDILWEGAEAGHAARYQGDAVPRLLAIAEDMLDRVYRQIPDKVAEFLFEAEYFAHFGADHSAEG